MQELFDFSTLYQTEPLSSMSKSHYSSSSSKLKEWWQSLKNHQKVLICQVDSQEIISSLNQAASGAFLLSKLNPEYKQKSFIHCKKYASNKSLISQEYEFSFEGKDMLPINIAKFFSTYNLQISNTTNLPKQPPFSKTTQQGASHSSLIKVKQQYVDMIPDMLETLIEEFPKDKRPLFKEEDYGKIYSILAEYSFRNFAVFRQIKSSFVQELLCGMTAISALLENRLCMLHQRYVSDILLLKTLPILIEENGSEMTFSEVRTLSPPLPFSNNRSSPSIGASEPEFPSISHNINQPVQFIINPSQLVGKFQVQNYHSEENKNNVERFMGNFNTFSFDNNPTFPLNMLTQNQNGVYSAGKEIAHPSENDRQEEAQNNYFESYSKMYEGFEIGDLQISFEPFDSIIIRLNNDDCDIDTLKREIAEQQAEELSIRKFTSSNPFYGRKNFANENDELNGLYIQKNMTDFLNGSNDSLTGNTFRLYGIGRSSPGKEIGIEGNWERNSWRNTDSESYGKREASRESRSSYGSTIDTNMQWGGPYVKNYGHKGYVGKGYTGREVRVYRPKQKIN